jgi:NAD(P)-dependent dehydrogenase (short-subunit alcohol dehydrogenase family)
MIEGGRGGAFVNVSSGAGITGVRGGAGYSAAKAGLQMLTRVTASEWGRHGIRANCVAVGLVASERALAAWEVGGIDHDAIIGGIPLRRVGRPADVAHAILFLASPAAAWISGQVLGVDGGPVLNGPPEEDG